MSQPERSGIKFGVDTIEALHFVNTIPYPSRMPRKGSSKLPSECDGSGTLEICSTTVPHKHCECGWPIERSVERCKLCVLEASGIRIHDAQQLIREVRERINHDMPEEGDKRSPFKQSEGVYNFGMMLNHRELQAIKRPRGRKPQGSDFDDDVRLSGN